VTSTNDGGVDHSGPNESEGADPAGVDSARVTDWLEAHVDAVARPLSFELITGGRSNLTFRVTDADGRRWVLRRPPLRQVLATAHDMAREHKIIAALGPTDVPVPSVVGLCTDDEVNGAPFYVMSFVEGTVIRDVTVAKELSVDQRRVAGESIVEVLARIHAVDIDAVGLGDLGKREDYLARQLRRWYMQFENSKTRDVPVVDEVHEALVKCMPRQGPSTIVHGDYRLDNCMIDDRGQVAAVLDWELCTLGDPLADVGLLIVYSPDASQARVTGVPSATSLDGFPTQPEILEHYARISGRDLSEIEYYVAFGNWKLACIIEGVYARYVGGAMGVQGQASDYDFFGQQVLIIAERARDALSRLS
jgi:aminoglycoside phosphotransferase (APT) family kinase protein